MSAMDVLRQLCTLLLILQVSIAYGDPKSEAPIWGTYRPQALTSIRARVPHSPTFGFIHHSIYEANLRHLAADRTEDIRSFSWRRHDGLDFGEHHVEDTRLNLRITTQFVRSADTHSWALRYSGEALHESLPTKPISAVFYGASGVETRKKSKGNTATSFKTHREGGRVDIIGKDGAVGDFLVSIQEPTKGSIDSIGKSVEKGASDASHARRRKRSDGLESKIGGLGRYYTNGVVGEEIRAWMVENHLAKKYSESMSDAVNAKSIPLRMKDERLDGGQTVFVQRILQVPFSLDVIFQDVTAGAKDSTVFKDPTSVTNAIETGLSSFDAKFDQVFGLRDLGDDEKELAKVSLSNVLGGIGYWHGQSVAEDPRSQHGMKELEPVSLLTATPSRATFPRGFLWDEGFHQLIVQKWNAKLSSECLQSWLSVMQPDGWIPREQILGLEARSRFPQHIQHLVIQKEDIANPPTLLMPLRVLASKYALNSSASSETDTETCASDDEEGVCNPAKKNAPSEPPSAFLVQAARKLKDYFEYVRVTQSGEDDDTFRWRGRSNDQKPGSGNYPLTLASGLDDYPRAFEADPSERHVDLHAWIAWAAGALAEMARATYSQSDHAHFSVLHEQLVKSLREKYYSSSSNLLCDHTGPVANCHEGYVTLLPFALGLLSPDDVLVSSALDALESDSRLRSPAGVRSLSAADSAYRQGDDYWTGPVWMPFNFLTLAALKTKYSAVDGPYRERSLKVYESLRRSVLDNALRVYKDTGYLWENYDPEDGSGRRGRQFTGWSALILLIYSDMYEGVVA